MIAMAPRAAGSVGHVPHAGGAAARLSGGIIWLETEGHASLMRSRRALGPARAPFFGTFGAVFSPAPAAPCFNRPETPRACPGSLANVPSRSLG